MHNTIDVNKEIYNLKYDLDINSEHLSATGYDLIVFCHLRWEFVFQRPQHIMLKMSETYKILFVEEPIVFTEEEKFTASFTKINANLTVMQPRVGSVAEIDKVLLKYLTQDKVPIAWFYSAAFIPLLSCVRFDKIVYDCMDELSLFKGASPELVSNEEYLLKVADIVFTGGKSLYEAKRKLHQNIHCYPSSVELAHFRQAQSDIPIPADIINLPKPVVGYYGVIDERIDFELLTSVAKQNPAVSFVMVGPLAKVEQKDLPKMDNIHFLGMRSYNELPGYLKGFDIAMMPFAMNEATKYISPTKTLEFMAASKPVISTPVYDVVRDYSDSISIIKNSQQFTNAIKALLAGKSSIDYSLILDKTSWDITVGKMKDHLQVLQLLKKVDIVIIGAGISGCVLAERYASSGKKVLIIEKRDHIAGNCFDYKDENNILVSKYGAHLFHTNDEQVWEYVNRFSDWYPWEHKVLAKVNGQNVPIPVNITTVNKIFDLAISTEEEMQQWLTANTLKSENPENGREAALSRVGPVLYEKMFNHYTKKQWGKYPEELDASVLNRIPVRISFDDRYFSDKHQALPQKGYTELFKNILSHPNIEVRLSADYFDIKNDLIGYDKLFYTGPVDRFFDFKFSLEDKLEYRSINFVTEHIDSEFFQENSVVNYPGTEVDFTRIIEYKHFGHQKSEKTSIVKEYTVDTGEPYYPVPNKKNQLMYERYKSEADKLKNVYFVGRLANYKYFNMDQAFKNALDLFAGLEEEVKVSELVHND